MRSTECHSSYKCFGVFITFSVQALFVVFFFYLCFEQCLNQDHMIIFSLVSTRITVSLFCFFTVEILSALLLNTHICQCSSEHNTRPHMLKDDEK